MFAEFESIIELLEAFPTEKSCIEFLEKERWPDGVKSPFDEKSVVWKCKSGSYKCKNTDKNFNVKTGTLMENTKLSLRKWFVAIWILTGQKKGMSSHQMARELNVTQTTAWYMAHRIRECFCQPDPDEPLDGIFESDESFYGGKNRFRHKDKKVPKSTGRSFKDKTPVLGLIHRNGNAWAYVVKDTSAASLHPIIHKLIKPGSILITDDWSGYNNIRNDIHHYVVKDTKKGYHKAYNKEIHTNSIEGFWGITKRGYNGIYNWWSPKHIKRYIDEFVFRYNTRKMSQYQRFCLFFSNIEHRLRYKELIAVA